MTTYCTTRQASDYFHVPTGTIRRWVHEGKLPRYGTKGRALYDMSDLLALVNLHKSVANATLSSVGDLSPQASPATETRRGSSMNGDAHGTV